MGYPFRFATATSKAREAVAEEIRSRIRKETGLTVSIAVSFSKIFAKRDSDMKKPDAAIIINKDNYHEKVLPLLCLNCC